MPIIAPTAAAPITARIVLLVEFIYLDFSFVPRMLKKLFQSVSAESVSIRAFCGKWYDILIVKEVICQFFR